MAWKGIKLPLTCLQAGQHPPGHGGHTVPQCGESGLVACHLTTERKREELYIQEGEGEKKCDI